MPSGVPADVSIPSFNETSITVAWKSPSENEINGILRSYQVEIYKQLDTGYLELVSNKTVPDTVLSWTFAALTKKTEYIIEVKAGTIVGFGPASVAHQKTSGDGKR